MSLATVDAGGQPSSRMVLLKGIERRRAFIFSRIMEAARRGRWRGMRRAAANMFWAELERQVCIEGTVEQLGREEAEAYFHSRPRGSQLGAWASRQSETVPNREYLEEKLREAAAAYEGRGNSGASFLGRVPAGAACRWNSGRAGRIALHDRLRYRRAEGSAWEIERLSP